MKKVISVVIVMVMLCLLCSCNNTQTYIKQDNINLNYNNISAGSGCWIGNDFIYSIENNLVFNLYVTDIKGKHRIRTLSYCYDAQVINDKLIYADDGISFGIEFFEYDLKAEKTRKIATINAERIYTYYLVDDILYVEVGKDDSLIKDIVAITLKTGKQITVAKNISACGVVNNQLNYISQKNSNCSIYKYDVKNDKSVLIGGFELKHMMYNDILDGVNFNSQYIAFVYRDEKTSKSRIYVYNYEKDTLKISDFPDVIYEFVSYDKFAFFKVESNSNEIVYRFNLSDNSIEKIVELPVYSSLFVGSDDEVYVSSDFGVRCYSAYGEYEEVILN